MKSPASRAKWSLSIPARRCGRACPSRMIPARRRRFPAAAAVARYLLPVGAHILVEKGGTVHPGDVLAKIPRETTKTKDITGGLPRVAELFEARKPKEQAVISEIDGEVSYEGFVKGMRRGALSIIKWVIVKEYFDPKGQARQCA